MTAASDKNEVKVFATSLAMRALLVAGMAASDDELDDAIQSYAMTYAPNGITVGELRRMMSAAHAEAIATTRAERDSL